MHAAASVSHGAQWAKSSAATKAAQIESAVADIYLAIGAVAFCKLSVRPKDSRQRVEHELGLPRGTLAHSSIVNASMKELLVMKAKRASQPTHELLSARNAIAAPPDSLRAAIWQPGTSCSGMEVTGATGVPTSV